MLNHFHDMYMPCLIVLSAADDLLDGRADEDGLEHDQ